MSGTYPAELGGGRRAWDDFRVTYADLTFCWQDLDGWHTSALPHVEPLTSLLHGWAADGQVVRARLGDGVVRHRTARPAATDGQRARWMSPWGWDDHGRSAQRRDADDGRLSVLAELHVDDENHETVFLLPANLAHRWNH